MDVSIGLYLFILTLTQDRCVWKGAEDVWSKPDSTSELGAQVIFSFLIIAEARCVWKGVEDVWSW